MFQMIRYVLFLNLGLTQIEKALVYICNNIMMDRAHSTSEIKPQLVKWILCQAKNLAQLQADDSKMFIQYITCIETECCTRSVLGELGAIFVLCIAQTPNLYPCPPPKKKNTEKNTINQNYHSYHCFRDFYYLFILSIASCWPSPPKAA